MINTLTSGALYVAVIFWPDGSADYVGPWRGEANCEESLQFNMDHNPGAESGVCVQEFNDTAPVSSPIPRRRP